MDNLPSCDNVKWRADTCIDNCYRTHKLKEPDDRQYISKDIRKKKHDKLVQAGSSMEQSQFAEKCP